MKRRLALFPFALAALLAATAAFAAGAPQAMEAASTGSVTVEGQAVAYKAVAGTLILKNAKQQPAASLFYVAYFKDGADAARRPVTFFYNGGPGSSTVFLHLGAFGPQRAKLRQLAHTPPPYQLINNDYSLLDATDMVFIDAPGTGYSRVLTKELGGDGDTKDYYGVDEDAKAFSAFIQQFLTEYGRWNSPKYLFGESYGGIRSSVLALDLENASVDLNGVIVLSGEFDTLMRPDLQFAEPGDDLPYALDLPSLAAVAWYHHKLPSQPAELEPFLKEVERYAMGDYLAALNAGATLDPKAARQVAEQLHAYTGLSVDYLLRADLRVQDPQFTHELLRDTDELTGYYDGRFKGPAVDPVGEYSEYDPLSSDVGPAYASAFLAYVHGTLKFDDQLPYVPFNADLNSNYNSWDYKHVVPGAGQALPLGVDVLTDLGNAMSQDPDLKLMLNTGYYDLALPFYAEVYQLQHLPMDAKLQKNISYAFYPTGHMAYDDDVSLKTLHDNVARFIAANHGG